MDQGNNFQIYYNNKFEAYPIQDYHALIEELEKKYDGKCLLFDWLSDNLVTPQNLVLYRKLILCRIKEIPILLKKIQEYDEELKQLTMDQQLQQENTEKQNTILGKAIFEKSVEGSEIKEQAKKLEKDNKALLQKVKELNAKEYKIQQLITQSQDFSNQIGNLNCARKNLQSENDKLSKENSQLIQFKLKSEQLDKDLQNLELEQRVQKIQNDELRIQLQEEVRFSQLQSEQLQNELKQSKEVIENLKIESEKLQIELLESKGQVNYQDKSSDDQQKLSQKQEQNVCDDVANFYTDEQQQEDKQIYGNQIKFQESIIKKILDEMHLIRQITLRNDKSSTFQQSNQFEVLQITLNEQQFQKCINEKNFFFRQNCIDKKRYDAQNIQDDQISISVNGQQVIIMKLHKLSIYEYEAIDIILNKLIVQAYFKIFQRDFQKNSKQQNWNLKIPRQFLVKDEFNNYYIYQECLQMQIKNFIPFSTTSPIEQYITQFFRHCYLATNKNLALTECQYGENNKNAEIVITNIIIHSNYLKGFSCFDLGKTKIEEFEEMLKSPGGTSQQLWSYELQDLATKVWNEQQQY
ncbi:unnamed protein product [Paramecium octaurelia]|uniref:Uncharacterized protein n=2 Tax=Paramecium octaurelia TaxID=43137 RepID=A0A8S1V873_PAROT|nr:unnamed protein product [Paramecium octaurelia]CAD8172667.1 unnamed protein product [Paramecium octaurelia]